MGAIYSSASLTLVAASGDDPTYGLPGISRPPTHYGQFGGTRDNPITCVHTSKWASRAWTFQESYLSQRRLLFTDAGLIFLCNTDMEMQGDVEWFNLERTRVALKDFAYQNSDYSVDGMFSILQQFARRDLSFESDALNAIIGVLNLFLARPDPIYHLCGVPMWYQETGRSALPILALNWETSDELNARRPGFPSWSPLGWKAKNFRFLPSETQFQCHADFGVKFFDNGQSRPLCRSGFDISAFETQYLLVFAYTLVLRIARWDSESFPLFVRPQSQRSRRYLPQWDLRDFEDIITSPFLCIFDSRDLHRGLILRCCGRFYERVGCLERLPVASDTERLSISPEIYLDNRHIERKSLLLR